MNGAALLVRDAQADCLPGLRQRNGLHNLSKGKGILHTPHTRKAYHFKKDFAECMKDLVDKHFSCGG